MFFPPYACVNEFKISNAVFIIIESSIADAKGVSGAIEETR
jgi:hypothetical protein